MDRLVGRLLSELHAAFPVSVCPGDWAWTTTLAGGLVALFPVLGAIMAAIARRWTGNRYGVGPVVLFALIGATTTVLLPWLVFAGSSLVFRGALDGRAAAVGLTRADLGTLQTQLCFNTSQVGYLGGSRSVRQVLGDVSAGWGAVFAGAVALLVVLPLLCWLFVYFQAKIAFRRGPKWPARLLWVPMLLLMLATAPQSATVTAHLWLGFLPVAVVGMIAVAMVGAPRWSTLERRSAEAGAIEARSSSPPALPPAPPRESRPA
ncbi:MAG TPA: serine/threonine protein kinase, partial [Pseudonocardiaceae bacterium]